MAMRYGPGDVPLAWIDTDPKGGPVRRIINGRHRKPTGRWLSTKVGRAMPWESTGERDLFILCEADPQVASFLAQPHRLTIRVEGRNRIVYFPDVRIDRVDGSVEIVEVKRNERDLADQDYARKLELAEAVYHGIGWRFRIRLSDEIRADPAFANAYEISLNAAASVPAQAMLAVFALYGDPGSAPLGHVADALGGGIAGRTRLHALVVQGVLSLDLATPLHDESPVHLLRRERPRPVAPAC